MTIPENVEPGKVFVVKLDVTATDDDWRIPEHMRHPVTLLVPGYQGKPLCAGYYDPKEQRVRDSSPFDTGEFKWHPVSRDGEVALFEPKSGYCIYYRKGLKDTLTFPEDADLVVNESDLRAFRLHVPYESLAETPSRIWLLKDETSHVPLSWADPITTSETPQRELSFRAKPGNYVVAYPSRRSLMPVLIGKVTMPENADGELVDIIPLEQ